MFYASHVQVGFWLYYWYCTEDADFNTFEFRKVDIRTNMEDHEVVKSVKVPRENSKYHALGVVMNKPLTKFTRLNEGVDESRLPKELEIQDYYLSIFYSNSEDK
jgi:hypothetical protein